ncbi:MAG TPA: exodeoxyribonuclease VII large subunit [Vicinamibacterales bacterium]|nr:exodeoxyribonuclease VII large subunit [Vicinamibacterales bacterium]
MPGPFGLPFDEPEPAPRRVAPAAAPIAPAPSVSAPSAPAPAAPAPSPPPPAPAHAVASARAAAPAPRVLSVTELTAAIRDHLESEFFAVWVEGELSNCKVWNTGHLYFTLKDDRSQLKGFMFRTQLRYLKFKPVDGVKVIARGRVSVYEPKGEYQITCDHLEPKGLGQLQLAYEQLKKRLQADGLFAEARKRPLPALPRRIGIVTSLDGAAIRDMLKVLGRRYRNAQIVIRSTRVQGEGSAFEIAQAIRAIQRVPGIDVLIVGRGGGSIEDLWAFNEEPVARAIADCPVPVISAVGHESDVTIADLVADRRAPTPSAAAEVVVASRDEFCHRIDRLRGRLDAAMDGRVQSSSRRVHVLSGRPALAGFPTRLALRGRDVTELTHRIGRSMRASLAGRERSMTLLRRQLESFDLGRRLAGFRTRLATGDGRLRTSMLRRHDRARARLGEGVGRLESLNPLAVLGRGYAVAWNAERTRALRSASEVTPGDRIRVTLADGELECDVRKTE